LLGLNNTKQIFLAEPICDILYGLTTKPKIYLEKTKMPFWQRPETRN